MEYTYELKGEGPTKLIVIDPATLSEEQKTLLLKATEGYIRGLNYWAMDRPAAVNNPLPQTP